MISKADLGRAKEILLGITRMPFSLMRPGNVALFHFGRCGSTVVGDLLGQHPRVFWDGEVYERMRTASLVEMRMTDDPITLLRLRMMQTGYRFYIFSFKPSPTEHLRASLVDMDLTEYVRRLQDLGYAHFIVLKRKNYLRQIISHLVAEKKRTYHISSRRHPSLTQVRLPLDATPKGGGVKPLFEWFEQFDAIYRQIGELVPEAQRLYLTYEQHIASDPLIGYHRICEFIGVDPVSASVRYGKTNPFEVSDMLTNFMEVERVLHGTSYEWMLYD
jgi:hypothetical protein